ncbi:MAG: hypothetical protein H5U13_05660 [Parvibaculum sp.]|nr:hypothetical protein [Parvibaculum sp.]
MANSERRLRAVAGYALVCGLLMGWPAAPARAGFEGAPDSAIFADHFAVLEAHEKLLNGAPAARPKPPSVSSLLTAPRRAPLPPLPDLHEIAGLTVAALAARADCPLCQPGPAAASMGLPVGLFEEARRRALKEGWRAGYDTMRPAVTRAEPPGVRSTAARRAYALRYIRRIVHSWQVAAARTLRAEKKITAEQSARYLAVLSRTLPPPGAAPEAPQRIRTGWVSDEEMAALDRRHVRKESPLRLEDADRRRIAERFAIPQGAPRREEDAVEGSDSVIPFARIATGYAESMLLGETRPLLPEEMQIWSETSGAWTLDGAKHRLVVSGGAAWPLDETTKIGTAVSWGRSWRDTSTGWGAESIYVSPFVTHGLTEHLSLRAFAGAGTRSDRVQGARYSADYRGTSLHSGASLDGAWRFGDLQFKPAGEVSLNRLALASPSAHGEVRSRGRATWRNGFVYDVPDSALFSTMRPYANLETRWTFDRAERDMAGATIRADDDFTGDIETGVAMKALADLLNMKVAAGVADLGQAGAANYTVSGKISLSF